MNELKKQALGQLVRFQFFLALMLFVPAWSLRFWQAWVYWGILGVSSLWSALYFLKRDPRLIASRLRGGPRHEREWSQKIILSIASALSFLAFCLPGIERRYRASVVPVPVVLLADALVVAAWVIVFRVFQANSHASAVVEVKAEQRVVSTGPYSRVRHPMYSGCTLLLLVTPLALGSVWAYAGTLPLIVLIGARAVYEERFLSRYLPGYEEYCRKVRYRVIPHVW